MSTHEYCGLIHVVPSACPFQPASRNSFLPKTTPKPTCGQGKKERLKRGRHHCFGGPSTPNLAVRSEFPLSIGLPQLRCNMICIPCSFTPLHNLLSSGIQYRHSRLLATTVLSATDWMNMGSNTTAAQFIERLNSCASPAERNKIEQHFKTCSTSPATCCTNSRAQRKCQRFVPSGFEAEHGKFRQRIPVRR